MTELLLHTATQHAHSQAVANPPHALLISAPSGAGKKTLAKSLAAQILGATVDTVAEHPAVLHIWAEKNSISIEQIRAIQAFLKLKVPGSKAIKRVVVIYDAHLMGHEAQNALLKSLEEPPADTVMILTATPDGGLLQTIYSRVQQLQPQPVSREETVAYFITQGYTDADITKAYQVADGQVGLIAAILQGEQTHPLMQGITRAKQIITGTSFERLRLIEEILKQDDIARLLQALKRVYGSLLVQASQKASHKDMTRTIQSLEAIEQAEQALTAHAAPKLVLTDLFLHL